MTHPSLRFDYGTPACYLKIPQWDTFWHILCHQRGTQRGTVSVLKALKCAGNQSSISARFSLVPLNQTLHCCAFCYVGPSQCSSPLPWRKEHLLRGDNLHVQCNVSVDMLIFISHTHIWVPHWLFLPNNLLIQRRLNIFSCVKRGEKSSFQIGSKIWGSVIL